MVIDMSYKDGSSTSTQHCFSKDHPRFLSCGDHWTKPNLATGVHVHDLSWQLFRARVAGAAALDMGWHGELLNRAILSQQWVIPQPFLRTCHVFFSCQYISIHASPKPLEISTGSSAWTGTWSRWTPCMVNRFSANNVEYHPRNRAN